MRRLKTDSPEAGQPIAVGQQVQTPLGKGVVRDIRNHGRLLVDINGRSFTFEREAATPFEIPGSTTRSNRRPPSHAEPASAGQPAAHTTATDVDLHGHTVEAAMARAESALNDALLEGHARLRVIHGRSGNRIRDALHRWLRQVPSVRSFRIDSSNPGVTVVEF